MAYCILVLITADSWYGDMLIRNAALDLVIPGFRSGWRKEHILHGPGL